MAGVRLVYRVPAPAIERVVEGHRCLELGEIVAIHAGIAERCREQAGRLRRQVEPPGIGAAHDDRQPRKRIRAKRKLLDHHVEGAPVASVVPERTPDIEGRGLETFRHWHHLRWCYEEEGGLWIDETADQPWAGNAHDLRPCPRHPDRASLGGAWRHSLRRNEQLAIRAPGGKAAFKRLGRAAVMPHPGTDALAELQSFLADNDDGGRQS